MRIFKTLLVDLLGFLTLAFIANYRFIDLTKALIIKLRETIFKFNPKGNFHMEIDFPSLSIQIETMN